MLSSLTWVSCAPVPEIFAPLQYTDFIDTPKFSRAWLKKLCPVRLAREKYS